MDSINKSIGVVLLGAPCSGKSTIGKRLAEHYAAEYISSGDIARKMGETNKKVSNDLISGKMAPEKFMRDAVYNRLKDEKSLFVLDGFPRFADQDKWLHEKLNNTVFYYIYIKCEYNELMSRASSRSRDDDTSFMSRMNYFIDNTYKMILDMKENDNIFEIDNTDGDIYDIIYKIRCYLEVELNAKNSGI